ncbi:hypothetical protein C8Q78DRAFT_956643, partial [Trametes maxima]
MATQSRSPDLRPASTPPISRAVASARSSTPTGTATRRATTRSRKLTPSQEAWSAAEKTVPDLQAARDFLQSRTLIPEGEHAISGPALVSGLLHFASSAPSSELARKGLIAFAHLAKAVVEEKTQSAVSGRVLELAEDQLRLRLDHHTSHVEERIEGFAAIVERMGSGLEECTAELRAVCERVRETERAMSEAQNSFQRARSEDGPNRGESTIPTPQLTLDSAPARVRRAATLADLLQRQVLIRGATILSEEGEPLSDEAIRDKARTAIGEMERGGLTAPNDASVEQAKVLPKGDVVFTMSSVEAARWLHKPAVSKQLARKMGMTAQVVE